MKVEDRRLKQLYTAAGARKSSKRINASKEGQERRLQNSVPLVDEGITNGIPSKN